MGRDKAMISLRGEPLLERTVRIALAMVESVLLVENVLVVGRSRPQGWKLEGVDFILDRESGLGPLGGISTALGAQDGAVLALACDMPMLEESTLAWLLDRAATELGRDGLVVMNSGRPEPLFSVYTQSVRALISHRIDQDKLSLWGLVEAGRFTTVDAPDRIHGSLLNVNSPVDLERFS